MTPLHDDGDNNQNANNIPCITLCIIPVSPNQNNYRFWRGTDVNKKKSSIHSGTTYAFVQLLGIISCSTHEIISPSVYISRWKFN